VRLASLLLCITLLACGGSDVASDAPSEPPPLDPTSSSDVRKIISVPPSVEDWRMASAVAAAFDAVAKFEREHSLGNHSAGMLERVEIVASKADFAARLESLGVAPNGEALAELTPKGVLIAVAHKVADEHVDRVSSDVHTYEWMLAKAVMRAVQLRLVGDSRDKLGPAWVREGVATMAAENVFVAADSWFAPLPAMSRDEAVAAAGASGSKSDRGHAAAVRHYLGRVPLSQLIAQAGRSDFDSWLEHAGRARQCPGVKELHAAVGLPLDSPEVQAVVATLGKPAGQHSHGKRTWRHFTAHGISLVVSGGATLEEVQLRAKPVGDSKGWWPYCGDLPKGLTFAMGEERVKKELGQPDESASRTASWLSAGYKLQFPEVFGKRIEIFRLTSRFEKGTMRLGTLKAKPNVMVGGVRCVELRFPFAYRDAEGEAGRPFFYVGLKQKDGTRVKGRFERSRHVDKGLVEVTYQPPLKGDAVVTIPYYALDLPVGSHTLTTHIEAVDDPSPGERGRPISLVGDSAKITLEMPAVRWLSVGVRSVTMAPGRYDDAVVKGDTKSGKPDPLWHVSLDTRPFADTMFESRPRQNNHRASWTSYSPVFPLLDGDTVAIKIYDEDVARDELVASFPLSHGQLKAGGVLKSSRIDALVLAPLRERRGR
jgi:hypothetical protein